MSVRKGLSVIAATAAGASLAGYHISKEYGFEISCQQEGKVVVNTADDHGIDFDCRDQSNPSVSVGIIAVKKSRCR